MVSTTKCSSPKKGLTEYQLMVSLLAHQLATRIWHEKTGRPIYNPERQYHLRGHQLRYASDGHRLFMGEVPSYVKRSREHLDQRAIEYYGLSKWWDQSLTFYCRKLGIYLENTEHPMIRETHRLDRLIFRFILGPGVTWTYFPGLLPHVPTVWRDLIERDLMIKGKFKGKTPHLINSERSTNDPPPPVVQYDRRKLNQKRYGRDAHYPAEPSTRMAKRNRESEPDSTSPPSQSWSSHSEWSPKG